MSVLCVNFASTEVMMSNYHKMEHKVPCELLQQAVSSSTILFTAKEIMNSWWFDWSLH